ncbi:MAG: hypothetical protein ABSD76_08890 [Terriglobales bacterium]|jgi:hypothetical protein
MRRIQFIEIHEQPWFPSSIRDEITDALQFGFGLLNAYAPIAPLLQRALDWARSSTNFGHSNVGQSVVDLCSGGGGPWLDLFRKLQSSTANGNPPALQIWLTDKYPNLGASQNVRGVSENRIRFYPTSVDAMNVPPELKGFRTMFTSFHHFSPDEARAILQNAVDAGEGIGIFEITRRAPTTIGLILAWDIMLLVCTPWIRPFRWPRFVWTYLVPIIPLVLLFDGVVSCLRTYRPKELREMVDKLTASDYVWEIGENLTGKAPITYLIGYRRASSPGFIQ